MLTEEKIARLYYQVKPFLTRRAQIAIRSVVAKAKRRLYRQRWPILEDAAAPPAGWTGWPCNKTFSVVLTHDVDTAAGAERCERLMALEKEMGFVSSFNLVAEGYPIPPELRSELALNGFEVGVHGLEHSGKMYHSYATFASYASQINAYLKRWGAVGFRSPCMYHNYEWLHALNILYDASSFDTDPFEPQSDGLNTIFPAFFEGNAQGDGYIELPYTLPQDFTLFVLLKERNIDIWKEKLQWIARHGGMVLLNTHPDYMCFSGKPRFDEYPASLYAEFLQHLKTAYEGEYWQVLPKEMAGFWSTRSDALFMTASDEIIKIKEGELSGDTGRVVAGLSPPSC